MQRTNLKLIIIMKTNSFKSGMATIAIMLFAWLNASAIMAQVKVADKEIIGVWVMSSMKYEGEGKELITDKYEQVKIYLANGEYACAEIVKNSNGLYCILPHEYGTYSLKDGKYTEMGRESGTIGWVDKRTFRGRWFKRMDEWKKVDNMPEKLTQHIIGKCKAAQASPANMQVLMKKYIFSK